MYTEVSIENIAVSFWHGVYVISMANIKISSQDTRLRTHLKHTTAPFSFVLSNMPFRFLFFFVVLVS